MSTKSIFLAAPNAEDMQPVIDRVVMPVLREAGLSIVRIPNLELDDIASHILEKVRGCDAMLAVVIGRNANVHWELGLAFALGKPLLLLAADPLEQGLLDAVAHCVLMSPDDDDMRRRLTAGLKQILPS